MNQCNGLSGPLRKIVGSTTRDVDVFLTGHTHAVYNCVMWGKRVTSAASYGRLVTRLQLEIDRRTGDVKRTRARNWLVGHWVMRAPDMTEMIARYRTFAAPLADRVVGRLADSASRYRDRSGESRMGNLVADAQWEAGGGDAAFIRPGQVRAGLAAGEVSYARAFMTQPFGTSLVSMTLTGAQLLDLLKEQWCGRSKTEVMHASAGVSYTWSATTARAIKNTPCASAPNPVTGLEIGGDPVEPEREYRITVNSGMANRDDNYPTLMRGTNRAGGPGGHEGAGRPPRALGRRHAADPAGPRATRARPLTASGRVCHDPWPSAPARVAHSAQPPRARALRRAGHRPLADPASPARRRARRGPARRRAAA